MINPTERELARLVGELLGRAYAIKDSDDGSPNSVGVRALASGMALAARRVQYALDLHCMLAAFARP